MTEGFGPTTPTGPRRWRLRRWCRPTARSWSCARTGGRWRAAGSGGSRMACARSSGCTCAGGARAGPRAAGAGGLGARCVRLGYRRARLDTAQSMTTAMGLYESAGYRPIPDYNGNSYASFWGEKSCDAAGDRAVRPRLRLLPLDAGVAADVGSEAAVVAGADRGRGRRPVAGGDAGRGAAGELAPGGGRWAGELGRCRAGRCCRTCPAEVCWRALRRAPAVIERGYRFVADHRSGFSRFVPGWAVRRATARVERRAGGSPPAWA